MDEIFSKIIENIEEKVLNKEIKIDKENFSEIKKVDQGRICFIDGGQAELLKGADFSLQFIRTAALIFEDNVKKDRKINEFFVFISMKEDNYHTEIFPVKGKSVEGIKINSFDATIREGKERASISKIGGIIRRFAELELAGDVVDEVDAVVLDGSLKCLVKGEEEKMNELLRKAEEKDTAVGGLAKTSKIIKDGKSILRKLMETEGEWYYKIEGGESVVKLNKSSSYVFEFNINKEKFRENVLGMMAANSNDAVFPGYPYGMILVDRLARVSNEEKDYLFTRLKSSAGKRWSKIRNGLNVLNSHDILDNI